MDPIQSDGEASPFITDEVDRLINLFEDTGACWYVVGGSRVIQPRLAFELSVTTESTDEGWRAMHAFARLFASNEEVRKATIEFAINVGAYYIELGNEQPVVSDGRTVQ